VIPLRDSTRSRSVPFVNTLLIAVNVAVFALELGMSPAGLERFFLTFGVVPARYLTGGRIDMLAVASNATPLVTAAFIHAGWLHLLGNMLYLWVFGDNIEDRLGHAGYALFYVATAVLSNAAHIAANPTSLIPTVGASGAVAGVLGAYLLLFPGARVLALVPIGFLFITEVPAVLFLFVWFLQQLLNGIAALGAPASVGGGVAWWAHIGGFVSGMALVTMFAPARRRNS